MIGKRTLFKEPKTITTVRTREAKQAKKKRSTHYQTSIPCPRCESTTRYVSSNACVPCSLQRVRAAREKEKATA